MVMLKRRTGGGREGERRRKRGAFISLPGAVMRKTERERQREKEKLQL